MARALAVSVATALPAEGGVALAASPAVLANVNAPDAAGKTGNFPVWNTSAFRRSFPAAWAAYLHKTFRTAYAVEKAFGIDSKTARDWWSGKRDPSGSFVAVVVARDPDALAILAPFISPEPARRPA